MFLSPLRLRYVVLFGLICAAPLCALDAAGVRPQITAASDKLCVKAENFLGAGIAPEDWAKYVEKNNPFDQRNTYFKIYINDRTSKKTLIRPTVPLEALWVSPSSAFILGISLSYPTAGIVVFDRHGVLLKKDFQVCLDKSGCHYIADDVLMWTDLRFVRVSFVDTPDGKDCSLNIASGTAGTYPSLAYNLCKKK